MIRLDASRLVGADDPDLILAGHSHVKSMLDSLNRAADLGLHAAVLLSRALSVPPLSEPGSVEDFVLSAEGRVAVVAWDGNQHIASFLVDTEPGFQVFQKGVVDASHDLGRVWVSEEMLRNHWRGDAPWTMDAFEDLLDRLATSCRRLVVLGTPPPKKDRLIRDVLGGDPFFRAILEKNSRSPEDIPLIPGPMRLAMWMVIQNCYREAASAVGALFVPVPDFVMDSDGFLLDRYSPNGDASHANGDYGAVMWGQLAEALSRTDA